MARESRRPSWLSRLSTAMSHPRAWRLGLALAFGLCAAAWAAHTFLKPVYHRARAASYAKQALGHLDAGDMASADLSLSNALRHEPQRVESWRLYARLLKAQGDPRYAVAEAQIAELQPEDEVQAVRALTACLESDNLALGSELAGPLAIQFPANAEVQHAASVIFLRSGKVGPASAALNAALKLAPTNAAYRVSEAALQLASPDEQVASMAVITLEDLRREAPFRASASASLARYYTSRDPARAEQLWGDVIQASPGYWAARMAQLAVAHTRTPGATPARLASAWEQATNLAQRVELVDMTLQTAGPEAALACLDRIPPEERNRPACRLAWLEISGRLGDWKQVVSLSAAAAEDPGYSTEQQIVLALWQVRGFKELGQQGGADTSLQRALKLSDGRPMFAFRAGARLLDWKLPQAARPLLEQAIRGSDAGIRDPALRHLIAIAESQGDAVAGLASAEQLLKLAPADVFARQSVAWYLLVTQGSAERARLMLADVQRSVPDAEPLREPLALLALRKGEPGVAVTNYMALAQGPRNHSSRVYFAASLAALGRTNDARAMLATVNPALLYTVARTEQDELVKGLGVKP